MDWKRYVHLMTHRQAPLASHFFFQNGQVPTDATEIVNRGDDNPGWHTAIHRILFVQEEYWSFHSYQGDNTALDVLFLLDT